MGYLTIIWDFDSPIGQLNASFPYKYRFVPLKEETENITRILQEAENYQIKMTFAITGYFAEEGVKPFSNPDLIAEIHRAGHEIASHSWRHEWFPHLSPEQARLSLQRSKHALESIIGEEVKGFVPPFSRPMSWYAKGALSAGDRSPRPLSATGNIGGLLPLLAETNYKWCRVAYRPIWQKVRKRLGYEYPMMEWERNQDVTCVPQHYMGFDDPACRVVIEAMERNTAAVICAHPLALSRPRKEHIDHFMNFLSFVQAHIEESHLIPCTVSEYIDHMEQENG